ncbi:MAG TPA: hypothetical protein VFH92_02965, partial [Phenylobacterium sp.]|nr:hypothetical protein [Phenylobacterium sp.]
DRGGPAGVRYLDIVDTIYTITEFVEFGYRMLGNVTYRSGGIIYINLRNTAARQLWVGPRRMPFFDPKETQAQDIELRREIDPSNSRVSAIDVSNSVLLELFDYFGWNPASSQIKADQEKFYRRDFW